MNVVAANTVKNMTYQISIILMRGTVWVYIRKWKSFYFSSLSIAQSQALSSQCNLCNLSSFYQFINLSRGLYIKKIYILFKLIYSLRSNVAYWVFTNATFIYLTRGMACTKSVKYLFLFVLMFIQHSNYNVCHIFQEQ